MNFEGMVKGKHAGIVFLWVYEQGGQDWPPRTGPSRFKS